MSWQLVKLTDGLTIPWKNQTGVAVNIGSMVVIGGRVGMLIQGVLVGDTTLANNAFGVVAIEGVFDAPKLNTDQYVEGQDLFWDTTNVNLTKNPVAAPAANIAPGLLYAGMSARGEFANGTRGLVKLKEGAQDPQFNISFPDQATNDITITNPYPFPIRIVDALIENNAANGANANSLQVCAAAAGGSPVTDAMSLNGKVAGDIVRNVSCFPATAQIAAATNFFLRQTKAGGVMGGIIRIRCTR